jgi:tetratricopeptide (TPR) repeat protein
MTVNNTKYSILLIIPLILLILLPAVSLADADRIFKENSKAVVLVIVYDEKGNKIGQGSGFIVRADGAVVTNYHVISKARDIKVKAGEKVFDVEGLIFTDEKNDLVILKAKAKDMPVVKLGVVEKANIGEHVYVISSHGRLENTITDGLLSGIIEMDGKREILQMTVPISPGSSGGPVFNRNGEVIGVASGGFLLPGEIRSLSLAMSVKLIKDKISSKRVTAIKESGLEDYGKTAWYWFFLGNGYDKSGMHKEAIDAYKQAIKIDPVLAYTHCGLGIVYYKSGKYKEAIEAWKQAIRIDLDFAEIHYNLGNAYYKSGKYKEAIEAYKQAIRMDPGFAMAHSNLGLAYADSGKYKEAIEAYKQAIRIKPDFAMTHNNLGAAYHESRKYKEAIEAYKQAIRMDPDDADAHYNLGLAYGYSGKYKEAIEAWKQAIRIDPDYAKAHNNLGIAYYNSGKYKEAIEAYKQAIRIKPDYADAHYNLGVTYVFLNDRGSALEQYKTLKSLDSELANKLFNSIYE